MRWSVALAAGLALYAYPNVVLGLLALAYFGTFAVAFVVALLGHDLSDPAPPGARAIREEQYRDVTLSIYRRH